MNRLSTEIIPIIKDIISLRLFSLSQKPFNFSPRQYNFFLQITDPIISQKSSGFSSRLHISLSSILQNVVRESNNAFLSEELASKINQKLTGFFYIPATKKVHFERVDIV